MLGIFFRLSTCFFSALQSAFSGPFGPRGSVQKIRFGPATSFFAWRMEGSNKTQRKAHSKKVSISF